MECPAWNNNGFDLRVILHLVASIAGPPANECCCKGLAQANHIIGQRSPDATVVWCGVRQGEGLGPYFILAGMSSLGCILGGSKWPIYNIPCHHTHWVWFTLHSLNPQFNLGLITDKTSQSPLSLYDLHLNAQGFHVNRTCTILKLRNHSMAHLFNIVTNVYFNHRLNDNICVCIFF